MFKMCPNRLMIQNNVEVNSIDMEDPAAGSQGRAHPMINSLKLSFYSCMVLDVTSLSGSVKFQDIFKEYMSVSVDSIYIIFSASYSQHLRFSR